MPNTLRGQAAIVGIGELAPIRRRPNRDLYSLLAEACYMAIADAGLRKSDIDGMIMEPDFGGAAGGMNSRLAEHMGIQPTWAAGCNMEGASGVVMATQAAAYVNAGLANFVLCATATAVSLLRRSGWSEYERIQHEGTPLTIFSTPAV